jgi:hypothetical protein
VRCYQENQALLDEVWERLALRFRGYPASLRALVGRFVKTLGPHPQRYFSGPDAGPVVHLPIWLAGPRSRRALPDLIEATALAYFYVRIQDNVVDEPHTRGQPPLLLLGNVFLADAIALLASFVKSDAFWTAARSAWSVFSAQTEAERVQIASPRAYPSAAFRRHARKVALARIPLYAVLAREHRNGKRDFAKVDRLIDLMGEAYGLVNDVLGCARDLAAGARTYLLGTAAASLPLKSRRNPQAIVRVLATTPLFESFLTRAIRIHRRAQRTGEALGVHNMAAFTEQRTARIAWHLQQATTLRLAVALAPRQTGQ